MSPKHVKIAILDLRRTRASLNQPRHRKHYQNRTQGIPTDCIPHAANHNLKNVEYILSRHCIRTKTTADYSQIWAHAQ
jgi:hypothetical protein